jgi:hypothetical protein
MAHIKQVSDSRGLSRAIMSDAEKREADRKMNKLIEKRVRQNQKNRTWEKIGLYRDDVEPYQLDDGNDTMVWFEKGEHSGVLDEPIGTTFYQKSPIDELEGYPSKEIRNKVSQKKLDDHEETNAISFVDYRMKPEERMKLYESKEAFEKDEKRR